MKQAIIDIGSNSIRLTLYKIEGDAFCILFREKIMAGLAGYVEKGRLTEEGIKCAYNSLREFQHTLQSLGIDKVAVFATASLRNITNTDAAVAAIRAKTGYKVDVISGEEEALFGYSGAMNELAIANGAFIDIGGASTEVVTFQDNLPMDSVSFGIGSLSLYRACVKKILPSDNAMDRIRKMIKETVKDDLPKPPKNSALVCVGGTARAVMRIAKHIHGLSEDANSISAKQLKEVCKMLAKADRPAIDLILKREPDRIHTLIPGAMILLHLCEKFESDEVIISRYGAREGYLCQKLLKA